jgi:ubiquitin
MSVPAPLPPAPDPVAPPPSPQMQVAQAGAELNALTTPAYGGGTPDGSLTSTPTQAAADLLNSDERSKGLERREGEIKADEQNQIAGKSDEAAAEKVQQAADFQNLLTQSQAKYESEHAQTQAAYNKYKAAAGTLKDPEAQFYEDKGQGVRVESALAAFAAGLGAGFNGNAGNPVLDRLHQKVELNFQAHKKNIDDLYNAAVESGKIEDTSENHARFMQDAKLKSYDLQGAHFKDELAAIAARSSSPLAKLAAQKTIEGIDHNQIDVRQKLAQQEAAQAATRLATDRARQREVLDFFQKSLEKHGDLAPEEARQEAAKDLVAAGYNASETIPILSANGFTTDPKTGALVPPKAAPRPEEPAELRYDADGKLVIPSRDPQTGKQLSPEVRQKMQDDAQKRTVIVDGSPKLAVNEEVAKKFPEFNRAYNESKRLSAVLDKAFKEGNESAYNDARGELIELGPVLYGFTRAPNVNQAGETVSADRAREEGIHDKGTIAATIPEYEAARIFGSALPQGIQSSINASTIAGVNEGPGRIRTKLAALHETLDSLNSLAREQTFAKSRDDKRKEAISKASPAQLAAALGGKPL